MDEDELVFLDTQTRLMQKNWECVATHGLTTTVTRHYIT